MNAFGLGLVLNFTDNASTGMQKASQSFQMMSKNADNMISSVDGSVSKLSNLSVVGTTLSMFGDTMMNTGSGIINMYDRVGRKITDVGMQMYTARAQLTSLYQGKDQAEEQLNNIMTYARKSVFAYQDVMKAVIMMKANGIEALEEVTSTSGKSTQKLMDYASDLAAFNPQMRNSYGTGVKAAMGAINEYITEGNAISLKRGASLDINSILGEGKADSIEGRTKQIADMMEKLNMVGLTVGLAKTPMQQLSNMGDLVFQTFSKITDNGVFQKFTEILSTVTEPIQKLADTTDIFDRVAKSVAQSLLAIMNPIQKVAEYLAKWIEPMLEFVAQHPKLLSMITVIVGIAGVSLLAAGMFLKLAGSITMLQVSLGLFRLSGLGGVNIIKMLITSLGGMLTAVLPLVAIAFVFYEAWKNNILGIRDVMKQFIADTSFLVSAIAQAFSADTLNVDVWQKAKDMGLLPFIETVLNLKHNVMDFINGFKQGLQEVKEFFIKVSNTMTPFGFTLKDVTDKISGLVDKFTGFKFSSNWEKAGSIFAKIAAALVIALPVIKLVSIAFGIMSSPIGLIAGGIFLLYKNFDKLKGILGKIPDLLKNLNLDGLGGYISIALLSLFSMIGGGGFAKNLGKVLIGIFQSAFGLVGASGSALFTVIPKLFGGIVSLLPAGGQLFFGAFAGIFKKGLPFVLGLVKNLGVKIGSSVGGFLLGGLGKIGGLIMSKLPAIGVKLVGGLGTLLGSIFGRFLPMLLRFAGPLGSGILSLLGIVFGPIISAIGGVPLLIGGAIIGAIAVITALVTGHGDSIKKAFNKIWNAIPEPIQGVITKVMSIVAGIGNRLIDAFGLRPLMDNIQKNLPKIIGWFSNVGNKIISIFGKLFSWVKGAWDGWLGDLIRNIGNFVGNVVQIAAGLLAFIIPIVLDLINGILDIVLPLVDSIGAVINDIMTVINGILDFIIGVFTGDWDRAWQGIVSIFSGLINGIGDIFKGAINLIIGLANTFIHALNKIKIPGTDIGVNLPDIPLLNTGGYVEKEGAAILHPSEVVVNAPMTKRLDEFLTTQSRAVPSVSNQIPQTQTPSSTSDSHDDNSVTFEKGSIVIQAPAGMSEAEMRSMAENIMKYAERKRQIDTMARKPRKEALA